MTVTAFVNVNVIPMDRERVLSAQTVLVQAGRILALGPATTVRVPQGAHHIDSRGKFLIPGLGDMHFHLMMADSAQAEKSLALLVVNGVTTIRNVDYLSKSDGLVGEALVQLEGAAALQLRARAAAGTLLSPRIYTSGSWPSYRHGDSSIARTIAAYQTAGYDFIKIHDEDRITFDSVVAAARRLNFPFMGHVPRDVPLDEALPAGYRSIEHLNAYLPALVKGDSSPKARAQLLEWPLMHNAPSQESDSAFLEVLRQHLDPARIPALAAATQRAGVWNCPTQELEELQMSDVRVDTLTELRYASPDSILQPKDLPKGEHSYDSEVRLVEGVGGTLDLHRRIIKSLQAAGAGLLLGTDSPAGGVAGFAVHRELVALVLAGLTPYQALATGTRNVAAYFGTLQESGTVAVGKRADLVLLDGNPLVDIHNTTRIQGVMLKGRWLSRTELDQRLASLCSATPKLSHGSCRHLR